MRLALCFFSLACALTMPTVTRAADTPPDGNYKLSFIFGTTEYTYWLLKLETKDGKVSAKMLSASPGGPGGTVASVSSDGKALRIALKMASGEAVFEGRLADTESKTIFGAMDVFQRLLPAELSKTDADKLTGNGVRNLSIAPLQKAAQLGFAGRVLRAKAKQAKEEDEKAKLLKQAAEADEQARVEIPKLYEEAFEKHADSPALFSAAVTLAQNATKYETSPEKLRAMLAKVDAARYGPRWQTEFETQFADVLAGQKNHAKLALELALRVDKSLGANGSLDMQSRVLKALRNAQVNLGLADAARETATRLNKVEEYLDKEYFAKVPPFKGEAFTGRKEKSDRTVVLELFTGAQCPPCVAADVAFDVLQKTYSPADLVLIQYHMHIPGPDPLTNASSEARWAYYSKKFPTDIRGTPSTLFNGKPEAGGGGGMLQAEGKYKQYRDIIDPLLETKTATRVALKAVRNGDKIDVHAEVNELEKPGKDMRLRLVLVEESIRYVGGNKLRFHHQVVRDLPGGPDGFILVDKNSKHTASIDLGDLRKKLTGYLEEYASKNSPFPNSDRPLDLNHLRVIALVQDDDSREILQAQQAEIK